MTTNNKAHYHLPGLFEFHELYKVFLPIYKNRSEYFYDWCDIGSIYGAPMGALWGGGRTGFGESNPLEVKQLMEEYGISARLTFSNSLLRDEHLKDEDCNHLCELFHNANNGIIVHSDTLTKYLKENYPAYQLISSTTKVITDKDMLLSELDDIDFSYVVPDFRFNKDYPFLKSLDDSKKAKVEFLCNECCNINCKDRKACYENVSHLNLGDDHPEHICRYDSSKDGYRFSKAMANPSFISVDDIKDRYLPLGFNNFKIEGRGLGSALVLEMLLYYMVKPQYQIHVREEIYLDNMLDLF